VYKRQQQTLRVLRRYCQLHQHPRLLFPNRGGGLHGAKLATSALDRGGVQRALHQVATGCGLKKTSPLTA
jgi:integrase/recombinase XerD